MCRHYNDVDLHPPGCSTALWLSANYGNSEGIRILLNCGADINFINEEGWTTLMCAVNNDDYNACRLILENGNFNLINSQVIRGPYSGRTALSMAKSSGIRDLLLRYGAYDNGSRHYTFEENNDLFDPDF